MAKFQWKRKSGTTSRQRWTSASYTTYYGVNTLAISWYRPFLYTAFTQTHPPYLRITLKKNSVFDYYICRTISVYRYSRNTGSRHFILFVLDTSFRIYGRHFGFGLLVEIAKLTNCQRRYQLLTNG